jgi:hypothetical protein
MSRSLLSSNVSMTDDQMIIISTAASSQFCQRTLRSGRSRTPNSAFSRGATTSAAAKEVEPLERRPLHFLVVGSDRGAEPTAAGEVTANLARPQHNQHAPLRGGVVKDARQILDSAVRGVVAAVASSRIDGSDGGSSGTSSSNGGMRRWQR